MTTEQCSETSLMTYLRGKVEFEHGQLLTLVQRYVSSNPAAQSRIMNAVRDYAEACCEATIEDRKNPNSDHNYVCK